MRRNSLFLFTLFALVNSFIPTLRVSAQQELVTRKTIDIIPQSAKDTSPIERLLPTEEDQEPGNAVPVLLRMVYEQSTFMSTEYPKLREYSAMELTNPALHNLPFDGFAKQIIRAGSMSFADWQYPLRSESPYLILLPDLQSQRQLVGHGMTTWVKQRLAKGDTTSALAGIRAQIACGRHCAATPVVICHIVGLAIAHAGLDNLELAMQRDECPNMYWSLAALPPTLQDIGPMVRWELWASPARLDLPLPPPGDAEWVAIAKKFVDTFEEVSEERYTVLEGQQLQINLERLAREELASKDFTEDEIGRMSREELIMRWISSQYLKFRAHMEPLAYQSPQQIIAAKFAIEAANTALLKETGAKSSPFPIVLPQGILACKNFARRVKFLQTIEAIRDFASKHEGKLPESLEQLDLPAPIDPFTDKPFEYETNGSTARLSQAEIEGWQSNRYVYELSIRK
jgi:hypothetical protein